MFLHGHNTTVLEILARQLGTAIAYKEMHHKEDKMTGYNLPPGCNDSDIPGNKLEDQGNRPEDQGWEILIEEFWNNEENCTKDIWEKFDKAKLSDTLMDIVDKAIQYGIDYNEKQCQMYAQMDREQNHFEIENQIEKFKEELFKIV